MDRFVEERSGKAIAAGRGHALDPTNLLSIPLES